MELDKLITQVNEIDKDISNVNSVFERFQKFKACIKSASDDIGKKKKSKDVIARLRKLYVEFGGKQIDWGDEPPPKETRRGGNTKEKVKTTTKSSDRILKDISENVGATFNQKVSVKIERMIQPPSKKAPVIVKKEKTDAAVAIKQENAGMLMPKATVVNKGAIPKKKQPARTKKRDQMKQSDFILQVPETITVDLVEENVKHSTRTKTKNCLEVPKSKRIRSPSTDSRETLQLSQAKRVKSNSRKIAASSSESEAYCTPPSDFDMNDSPERNSKINLNNNIYKAKPVVKLVRLRMSVFNRYREKMISENMDTDNEVQKKLEEVLPTNIATIMTDDESMDEEIKHKENENRVSPVKKQVEAFEKLATEVIIDTPVQRVTRTKTRNLVKTKLEETQVQTPVKADRNKEVFTSNFVGFNPTSVSTEKIDRKMPPQSIPSKTLCAIKASQQEFRELEERRRKRETDMAKKREAIIQAGKDAKHLRELEKERMLQQKQREDAEKKKILAKERSEERRREEELRRAEEETLKKLEEKERLELQKKTAMKTGVQKNLAVYMVEKEPLLPSYDCYDSDDPEARTSNARLQRPDWTKSVSMHSSLKTMLFIEDKLKNTLYCPTAQTPDLQEIFENIDPEKLRRNSSAIWNYQPRFTRMPSVEEDF